LSVIHPIDANIQTCEHWQCGPSKLYYC